VALNTINLTQTFLTLVSYGRGQGTSFVKNQYKKDKHMGKMMSVIINFFSSLNINIK
jgi:hypothetical protein